ncbi:zinc-binding dehydrogenase [Streptomyces sp. LBUM 1478]|nr:zinc-binding dehydrogenase [Streptomyces sp. LBUM 1478]
MKCRVRVHHRTEPGSVVAVVGCGPVGLSYVQAARLALAAQIIAIDPLPHRREAALRLGATTALDPTEVDPVEAVMDLSGTSGASTRGAAPTSSSRRRARPGPSSRHGP